MNNCRSQFGWQCAQLKESAIRRVVERQVTRELPVHVVLLPPLLVPQLLQRAYINISSLVVGSAAASSSGAGTDGATSTASRLLFSGFPSEVSSSLAVVVTKCSRFYSCRPPHGPVDASSLIFLHHRSQVIQARTFIRRIHHNEVEQDTF